MFHPRGGLAILSVVQGLIVENSRPAVSLIVTLKEMGRGEESYSGGGSKSIHPQTVACAAIGSRIFSNRRPPNNSIFRDGVGGGLIQTRDMCSETSVGLIHLSGNSFLRCCKTSILKWLIVAGVSCRLTILANIYRETGEIYLLLYRHAIWPVSRLSPMKVASSRTENGGFSAFRSAVRMMIAATIHTNAVRITPAVTTAVFRKFILIVRQITAVIAPIAVTEVF